jgi:hypothetical protein
MRHHSTTHCEGTDQAIKEEDETEEGLDVAKDPVTCHNCLQQGHYAWECPLPPVNCMYCHASDHETEECRTLLVNIQEKRNQNN